MFSETAQDHRAQARGIISLIPLSWLLSYSEAVTVLERSLQMFPAVSVGQLQWAVP